MPVRRGHVALQNTYLDTIIRKFDGQNRKFLIANAQMKNCGIIYCNEGFCQMFGFSRAEIMQQPCTCHFLVGPGTMKSALSQLAQALLGSEERKLEILYYSKDDVIPVKNEEGVVIMFILNFEELLEPALKLGFRQRVTQGWIRTAQKRKLRLRMPSLRVTRQPSYPKDPFEGVVVDYLQPPGEDVVLKSFPEPCKESSLQYALKSNNVSSTSDSDLMRHRAIGRIPQVTLSFGAERIRPPSPTEIEIIAPSKIKDRTQNVSEKVTQVTQVKRTCIYMQFQM
ncbi:Potassium voltage-gated channel subfamily H member 6 [Bagarius yarrelli]|uniref:Potassium voltage-gated channel subfamily H member 6 n=1 Tax=Bagarius yarrelli TaxID=175774 RepID=A0A556VJV8_BAGYA|nr:Potassium voltage-gated channel subfamily H member 6 [Bagarius yarrelli]